MAKVNVHLLIFTRQLSAMVQSHLPLLDVMKNLARETPKKKLKKIVYDVCRDVEQGIDFGSALAARPKIFNEIFVSIVSAGMMSGRLGEALGQLTDYLGKVDENRKKMQTALTYPIFIGCAFFVALNINVFYVLPKFQSMFGSFGKELPMSTQILINLGDFWSHYWYMAALFTGAIVVFLTVILNTSEGRYFWDKYKLNFPVVGKMSRMGSFGRFLRTLSVQLENDVDLLKALALSSSATDNSFLQETISYIIDDVKCGKSMAEAFRYHQVFGGLVLQMISSGEEAGEFPFLLLSAANYYDGLLENQIERWVSLINPILTIVIGMVIAFMLIATFMPVFEMGNLAG